MMEKNISARTVTQKPYKDEIPCQAIANNLNSNVSPTELGNRQLRQCTGHSGVITGSGSGIFWGRKTSRNLVRHPSYQLT